MRLFLTGVFAVLLLIVVAFFHYTLPQRDVVRITGAEPIRMDFSGWNRIFFAQADSGTSEGINRDVRIINAVRENGRVVVYRNEDTGFGWPPYFKFDTANLQAEALDLVSTRDAPRWVVVTHYGWRSEFLTIFPNAVSLREVEGPDDVTWVPWLNIIIFALLALVLLGVFRLLQRFKRRKIDPLMDRMEDRIDQGRIRAAAAGDSVGSPVRSWWRRWFGSTG
ncbi:MAG: DUF1523 family protein [Pseudomonadota bacterium]